MYRKTHRRVTGGETFDISMTPLIDTALTLLIIFMITAPMMQNSVKLTLPDGSQKEDGGVPQDVVVSLDAAGKLAVNGKASSKENVTDMIKREMRLLKVEMVYVKADKSAPYGQVMDVIEKIKAVGGIKHVALATKKGK